MNNFNVQQLGQFLPILLLFVVFYFFLIVPEKKRKKKVAEMRATLQVGNEITTIGGVIGKIVDIKDETITIESGADRTKLKFAKWAISNVNAAGEVGPEQA